MANDLVTNPGESADDPQVRLEHLEDLLAVRDQRISELSLKLGERMATVDEIPVIDVPAPVIPDDIDAALALARTVYRELARLACPAAVRFDEEPEIRDGKDHVWVQAWVRVSKEKA